MAATLFMLQGAEGGRAGRATGGLAGNDARHRIRGPL